MNWNKYFDAIWCLDYKPHVFRKQEIIKEFDRVGILQHSNFKFHETFPSPYDEYFYNCLLRDNKLNRMFSTSPGNMNATFGHYAIIKKSILDKYNRILIIENDVCFLKDILLIEKILDNLPSNYDIILFDYFMHCSTTEFNNYKKINEYYSEYENLASTGCYSLTNKAMQVLAYLYEQKIYPADVYTSKINVKQVLNKAFTPHALACQRTYKNSMNCLSDNILSLHNAYKKTNLNYDEYNMNNGKPYKYGDVINEEGI